MIPSGLRKLVAVLAGVLLAGIPVVAINHGLSAYIARKADEEVRLAAQRAVARADWRIGQVIAALETVATAELASCAEAELDALRRAVMTTTPIKELSVVNADGTVRCQHLGLATQSWPLSRELSTADAGVFIAVVRPLDLRGRALRVTWRRPGETLALVAFVPSDMFLPDASASPAASEPEVRLTLNEGSLIAAPANAQDPVARSDVAFAQRQSTRFPLMATASVARSAIVAEHGDLITVGALGSGILALMILALAILAPWRARGDPVAEMERAIAAGEFVPYYQPIMDIRSGRMVGAEVLIRWRKADGIQSPATFIPLAESSGLIVAMTRMLMAAARDETAAALALRPRFKLGFNLTARHFGDEVIVDDVRRIFADSPIRLSQIVLEVTERQPLEDLIAARRVIASLQGLGCRIAIDDVGTGHGGLSYMLKLGVDFIKVDKMFVDAIGTERYSTTIIETLVALAKTMRMGIMAEGVETFEQVTYLRNHGIHVAQGYAFAPPLPGASFLQLLDAADPTAAAKSAGAIQELAPRRRMAAA